MTGASKATELHILTTGSTGGDLVLIILSIQSELEDVLCFGKSRGISERCSGQKLDSV